MTEFLVDCPCGRKKTVLESQAGMTLTCECGHDIYVPRLGELRRAAGLTSYKENTAETIERMVKSGELPDGEFCASCLRPTSESYCVYADCESVHVSDSALPKGLSFLLVFFPKIGLLRLLGHNRTERTHGHDVIVKLPLRICQECNPPLRSDWGYSALLGLGAMAGIGLIFWHLYVGLAVIAVTALAWLAKRDPQQVRAKHLRPLLLKTPIYRQLFEEYPKALLTLPL